MFASKSKFIQVFGLVALFALAGTSEASAQPDQTGNVNGNFGNCGGTGEGPPLAVDDETNAYLTAVGLQHTCFAFTAPGSFNPVGGVFGLSIQQSELFGLTFGIDAEKETWGLKLNWKDGDTVGLFSAYGSTRGCSLHVKFTGIAEFNLPRGFSNDETCNMPTGATLPCLSDQVGSDGRPLPGQDCYVIGQEPAVTPAAASSLAPATSDPNGANLPETDRAAEQRVALQAAYINDTYKTEIANTKILNTPADGALGHSASIVTLSLDSDFRGGSQIGRAHKVSKLNRYGAVEVETNLDYTFASYEAGTSNQAITMNNRLVLPLKGGKLGVSIPLTYQTIGDQSGFGGSVGVSYTREIVQKRDVSWSLTPSARYITNKIEDAVEAGSFASTSLTSDVSFKVSGLALNVANSVNYTTSIGAGFFEGSDIYDYSGISVTNGISAGKRFNENVGGSVFYVDTRHLGADFYETYKGELGVAASFAEAIDTSVSGLVGSQSYGMKGNVKFSF